MALIEQIIKKKQLMQDSLWDDSFFLLSKDFDVFL